MQPQPNTFKFDVNHGIAPYCREILSDNINKSHFISVLFDKSFNEYIYTQIVKWI